MRLALRGVSVFPEWNPDRDPCCTTIPDSGARRDDTLLHNWRRTQWLRLICTWQREVHLVHLERQTWRIGGADYDEDDVKGRWSDSLIACNFHIVLMTMRGHGVSKHLENCFDRGMLSPYFLALETLLFSAMLYEWIMIWLTLTDAG